MPISKRIGLMGLACAWIALGCSASHAASPPAIQGKSVVVSWTENRMQRRPDEAHARPAIRQGTFSVYVSSAGRIFNRLTMANPKRGKSGSSDRIGDTGNRSITFEGRTMAAVQSGATGGARRILVTFAEGFARCTAEVIRGKQEGAEKMVARSTITPGATVEILSVQTSGVSCAVKDGNVFGGE
jgi:hypothetical protein